MMRSDQGGNEEDEWEEGGDVGFEEHGADDGVGIMGGDVLGDGLTDETEHDEEGDQEVLHLIFMICQ